MNSRERVKRTLAFEGTDRLAVDVWVLPAAIEQHGEALLELLDRYKGDIRGVGGPQDMGSNPAYYQVGEMVDEWGNGWKSLQSGIIGEVKRPALADFSRAATYQPPTEDFLQRFDQQKPQIDAQVDALHAQGLFVNGGSVSLFERMQYLRGTEQLYCDIACGEEELDTIAGIVFDYYLAYVSRWVKTDVDAIGFGDDWGSQRSLLISPDTWRRFFRPMYSRLIGMCKAAGKKVFFHSDGCIMDLYPDFIDMGVDAVNSQLWCMDIEKIARNYAGKLTFWGEISRQTTLPFGTPDDVRACAERMKRLFWNGLGGLIGQGEINRGVPLQNIKALLTCWNP